MEIIQFMSISNSEKNYRSFVGPDELYDLRGAHQFNILTMNGLRENHYLLEIACGSLRAGRLFIPYLLPKRYYAIEAEQWLIDEGIKNNLGNDIIDIKQPTFSIDKNLNLTTFNQSFDFILAHGIFIHFTSDQIKRCLSEAKKVLKSNGLFFADFLIGDTNNSKQEIQYPQVACYTLDYIENMIKEAGFVWKKLNIIHSTKGDRPWFVLVHPENRQRLEQFD